MGCYDYQAYLEEFKNHPIHHFLKKKLLIITYSCYALKLHEDCRMCSSTNTHQPITVVITSLQNVGFKVITA